MRKKRRFVTHENGKTDFEDANKRLFVAHENK